MEVQKGTISSMNGSTATVVPSDHPDIQTQPLVVPFYWRKTMGNIQTGEQVYFFEDGEHGGYIIGRTDGDWDNTIRGTLMVTADVIGLSDIKAGSVSLQNHIHTSAAPGTQTTPPTA